MCLSINTEKTEFIVFRPRRLNFGVRLTLKLNQKKLFESSKIRYLGVIQDDIQDPDTSSNIHIEIFIF